MSLIKRIDEASRNQLLSKSRSSIKGKQRYNKRNKSHIANTVREYNNIDMDKLFKKNILSVNISVHGETDDYVVRISFGGFLDILRKELKANGEKLDLRVIIRALITGFNQDDVYIHCSCPDHKYRFAYWSTKNDYNSGEPQYSNGKWIRNPDDSLGSACKHVLLVLGNTSWIIKVGSVINNYISYMQKYYPKLYADIIYPAVYGKKYTEPVQLPLEDEDELITLSDTDTIDTANKYGRTKGQFKKGNKQGIRFAPNNDTDDQEKIDIDIDTD